MYTQLLRQVCLGLYDFLGALELTHISKTNRTILRRAPDEDGNNPPPCARLCNAKHISIGTPRSASPAAKLKRAVPASYDPLKTFWNRALHALNLEDQASLTDYIIGVTLQTQGPAGSALFSNDDRDLLFPVRGNDYKTPASRFDAFGDQAFPLGINHLSGCTFVVIVSPQGVWMAHYWEYVGFHRWGGVGTNSGAEYPDSVQTLTMRPTRS